LGNLIYSPQRLTEIKEAKYPLYIYYYPAQCYQRSLVKSIKVIIYLTPLIPLSFEGEGEGKKGDRVNK